MCMGRWVGGLLVWRGRGAGGGIQQECVFLTSGDLNKLKLDKLQNMVKDAEECLRACRHAVPLGSSSDAGKLTIATTNLDARMGRLVLDKQGSTKFKHPFELGYAFFEDSTHNYRQKYRDIQYSSHSRTNTYSTVQYKTAHTIVQRGTAYYGIQAFSSATTAQHSAVQHSTSLQNSNRGPRRCPSSRSCRRRPRLCSTSGRSTLRTRRTSRRSLEAATGPTQ